MGNHSAQVRHLSRRPPHHRTGAAAPSPTRLRHRLRGVPKLLALAVALLLPLIPSGIAAALPGGDGRMGAAIPGLGGASMPASHADSEPGVVDDSETDSVEDSPSGATGALGQLSVPGVPVPAEPGVGSDSMQTVPSGAAINRVVFVTPHMVDLFIQSPAMGRELPVRLFLPRDWYTQPGARFPALYLLHGANDRNDFQSWTIYTDAEQFFADKNVLVVQPSAGLTAMHTNWWNYGEGGPPRWETFHTVEVRQVVEQFWRSSDRRAVAGLSSGGFGAMSYAARNPELFSAAASYSGYPHTTLPGVDRSIQLMVASAGEDMTAMWGDPQLQGSIWRAHDPWWLAEDLRGMELYVSGATGMRGQHNEPLTDVVEDLQEEPEEALQFNTLTTSLEALSYYSSTSFVERLDVLGIPVETSFNLAGTHIWEYWYDEMVNSWSTTLAPGLGLPA